MANNMMQNMGKMMKMSDPFANDPFFSDKGFDSIDKMMSEMRSEMRRGIDHSGMAQ